MLAMADFLRGRWPGNRELPSAVSRFLIGSETGWGYEEINEMTEAEFKINSRLARIYYNLAGRNQKIA